MSVRASGLALLGCALCAVVSVTTAAQTAPDGQGQRGGRGGWGGGAGMMSRGTVGTVTEVAADHYTIKSESGDIYTIHFSANTRIMKQPAGMRGQGGERGQGGGTPPEAIKPTDIKVGDAIAAMGEVDATAKSVGAVAVFLIDPERARQMKAMEANYGKTWLMGKVTAIDGVNVTINGGLDHATHSFVADENTSFRKRRDPITLADIQVGDTVRVEGAVKGGSFVAATVNAMGPPPQGNGPRTPAAPTQ